MPEGVFNLTQKAPLQKLWRHLLQQLLWQRAGITLLSSTGASVRHVPLALAAEKLIYGFLTEHWQANLSTPEHLCIDYSRFFNHTLTQMSSNL